jgi:hypothetical protein
MAHRRIVVVGASAGGLAAIKARGGIAAAQEPRDAIYPAMPSSAIEQVGADHVVPGGRHGRAAGSPHQGAGGRRLPLPLPRRARVVPEADPGKLIGAGQLLHPLARPPATGEGVGGG